jgi:hypothetical protein
MTEKLELRQEMKPSYLIQRLKRPNHWTRLDGTKVDNPFNFGGGLVNGGLPKEVMDVLREIFSFDYMGSAEFEFGAVPEALRFLVIEYRRGKTTTGTVQEVFYICPTSYKNEVVKRITEFKSAEPQGHTKEHVGLYERLKDPTGYYRDLVGWFEISNGYIFFVDEKAYQGFLEFLKLFKK